MKVNTNHHVFSLLLLAACTGADPIDDVTPELPVASLPDEHGRPDGPTEAPSAILTEDPVAATSPRSLFALSLEDTAAVRDVIRTDGQGQAAEILEQRIRTTIDGEVHLVVEVPEPTGHVARTLVSDTVKAPNPEGGEVLCSYTSGGGPVSTGDPRCKTTAPVASEVASDGPLTTATWTLSVVDVATGSPVPSCAIAGERRLECYLPATRGSEYQVLVSVAGLGDLWNGSPGPADVLLAGFRFTGALASQHEYQCWDWRYEADKSYCRVRWVFTRFTGIDTARLELDPIAIRLTANGRTETKRGPALTWDGGDADLPGAH